MIKGTSVEILGGRLESKTISIGLRCFYWCMKGLNIAFLSLSKKSVKLAMDMLESYIKTAGLRHNLKVKSADVYDLIDVEKTARFTGPNLPIVHNCLGIQYQMGKASLAAKLTQDTGEDHSIDDAEYLINLFYLSYPKYKKWINSVLMTYRRNEYLILPCGWVMFKDNPNFRSISNFPIQGAGSSVMREAVHIARKKMRLKVIYTLHDALSVEFEVGREATVAKKLSEAMQLGFQKVLDTKEEIRLDPTLWGMDYYPGRNLFQTCLGTIKAEQIYIDKRAKPDYERFKKYFYTKAEREYFDCLNS